MAPKSRIVVTSHYPQFRTQMHRAVRHGVEKGSEAGASAAGSMTPLGDGKRGVMPGHARATLQPMQIQRMRRGGYRGGFGSADPTILWLAHGTKGRRSKKLHKDFARDEAARKMLRETKAGRAFGVRPNPFMRRALVGVALPVAIRAMRQGAGRRLG